MSGVNDLVTGRLAGACAGDYDVDGGVTSIQSPPITLPATGTLTLSFQYYLAHGSNSSNPDFFRARVVGPRRRPRSSSRWARPQTATAPGRAVERQLSAFAGQTVRIRFEAADA